MDIRLSMPMASVAGVARAQSEGTDKDRGPAGGGVAEQQRISDNLELHVGNRSEDRDADGRQLLDRQPDKHPQEHGQPGHSSQDDGHDSEHRKSASTGNEGLKLDLEA